MCTSHYIYIISDIKAAPLDCLHEMLCSNKIVYNYLHCYNMVIEIAQPMTNECCIIGGSGAVDYVQVSPVDHTKMVKSGA